MITAHYITNQGRRKNNEDAILLCNEIITNNSVGIKTVEENQALFIVADGMGGYNRGEYASWLILNSFKESDFNLEINIKQAKEKLDQEVKKDKTLLNFGAVIAGIFIDHNRATIFNCGDSRVYRYNSGFLEQLSYDHSIVQQLVELGEIELKEMRKHPKKNMVTSAICGDLTNELPLFYSKEINLKANTIFFICSDGIWESGDIEEIETCFLDLNSCLECLEKLVLKSDVEDNFSGVVLEIKLGNRENLDSKDKK